MPSTLERLAVPENLNESILNHARRQELLDRAFELRSGRERPGQFWKIDLDALDFSTLTIAAPSSPRISDPDKSGVIACDEMVGIMGINPEVVEVAMRGAGNVAEAAAAVAAHDQASAGLVKRVLVLGIHDQVGEIERAPDHILAAVQRGPGPSAIARNRDVVQVFAGLGVIASDGDPAPRVSHCDRKNAALALS